MKRWEGRLGDLVLTDDKSQLRLDACNSKTLVTVVVGDRPLRDWLGSKDRNPNDIVHLEFRGAGDSITLDAAKDASDEGFSGWTRAIALVLAELMLLALVRLFVGQSTAALILGEDNRYSKSKFQMAVWFSVLIASYGATVTLRLLSKHPVVVGGVDIPPHLALLSGLSAFTFAAAKGITTASDQKAKVAAASGKPLGPPKTYNPGRASFPSDLVMDDDGRPDLGDFQMIVVTLLAVIVYLVAVYRFLGTLPLGARVSLPDVDTTILATFGLGQGAYLAKKAVSQ